MQANILPFNPSFEVTSADFKNWAGGFSSITAAASFASSGGIPITPVVSGGQISKIRLEHIWVEAAIDFLPSRGARNLDADSWVEMDPSYKQYEYKKVWMRSPSAASIPSRWRKASSLAAPLTKPKAGPRALTPASCKMPRPRRSKSWKPTSSPT